MILKSYAGVKYYKNQTPASKDMSKGDAAEIGAQALWSVYGLNLEGQVIEMGSCSGDNVG